MTEKPPLWADLLLTLWVLVVAVFYFGGYFLPAQIGLYTQAGAAFYALMLLVSAGTLAWNYLHRAEEKRRQRKKTKRTTAKDTRTKIRKNTLRCELTKRSLPLAALVPLFLDAGCRRRARIPGRRRGAPPMLLRLCLPVHVRERAGQLRPGRRLPSGPSGLWRRGRQRAVHDLD